MRPPIALMLCACLTGPALADTAESARTLLTATTIQARDAALAALEAAEGDALADYAAGAGRFLVALEGLGQGLHRHGFESPRSVLLPLMRMPVPENASPQPLTYEGFRDIIGAFREGMAAAAMSLAKVPADADIAVDVDLTRVGIDLDEDGTIAPQESIAGIMAAFSGGNGSGGDASALGFRFDRADGYWLQGYANVLMAQADFWLAHDFRNAFDGSFHMVFPRASLPLQDDLVPKEAAPGDIFAAEWRIADFISLIHYINWPVVEPERRRAARSELLEMIRLSRENWRAIRAETDNDREWLPGPQQKGVSPLTGLEVGEEEVAAWEAALSLAEDLLEGRTLLPHFRITGKGIDLRRFFEEPQAFDLVPMITGPGIVPYLATGKVLTAAEFEAVRSRFGSSGMLPFAIWFN